jgi:proteasome accessory factor C
MSKQSGVNIQSRERLVALLLLLERAFLERHPLTQEEILRQLKVDEYPVTSGRPKKILAYEGSDAAVRQKFERDKKMIRERGFDIETVLGVDGIARYQVDPASAYAPVIHFTDDELRVVRLALQFCGFGRSGAFSVFGDGPTGAGGLEYSAYVGPIMRALKLGRSISFEYESSVRKVRTVDPLQLVSADGMTYLVARVTGTEEVKGYRLSRMTSAPLVTSERFEKDEAGTELAHRWTPKYQKSPQPLAVKVETNANYAELLQRQYPHAIQKTKESGKVEVALDFGDTHAALRFVLGAAERVRLTSPASLEKVLRSWLKGVNRGTIPDLSNVTFATPSITNVLGQTLQLLHAVYQAEDGLRISELASRFEMEAEDVRTIMDRLATLEPLAEVYEGPWRFPARVMKYCDDWDNEASDDSLYQAEYIDENDEPSSLMLPDLFELNVALREASRLDVEPAIFTAIDKLEAVAADFIRIEHSNDEELLATVNAAVAQQEEIRMVYLRGFEDSAEERTIAPREVKVLNGHSYVRAWCFSRQGWRTFRIDRIASIVAKSPRSIDFPLDDTPDWLVQMGDSGDEVVVVVDAASRYIFEPLPGARWAALGDGRHVVSFHVVTADFLDHLLLLAGPGAVVASPAFAGAGRELAKRILDAL